MRTEAPRQSREGITRNSKQSRRRAGDKPGGNWVVNDWKANPDSFPLLPLSLSPPSLSTALDQQQLSTSRRHTHTMEKEVGREKGVEKREQCQQQISAKRGEEEEEEEGLSGTKAKPTSPPLLSSACPSLRVPCFALSGNQMEKELFLFFFSLSTTGRSRSTIWQEQGFYIMRMINTNSGGIDTVHSST